MRIPVGKAVNGTKWEAFAGIRNISVASKRRDAKSGACIHSQINNEKNCHKKAQEAQREIDTPNPFVLLVPFCGDAYLLIRRVLPPPLIDRLILRATNSAFANTRRKFSPRILRMSCSL